MKGKIVVFILLLCVGFASHVKSQNMEYDDMRLCRIDHYIDGTNTYGTTPLADIARFCADCNTAMAKAEFRARWNYLDSVSRGSNIPVDDQLWSRYGRSLERLTQIVANEDNYSDNATLREWWAWFMLHSDYLCWDSYNRCFYINSSPAIITQQTAPILYFGDPPRKKFVPAF